MTVIALVMSSPATAEIKSPLSCAQFLAKFEVANVATGRKLPTLHFEKKADNDLQIINIENIQAAVSCSQDGNFEGLGASLLNNGDADVERFGYLANAAVLATDSELDVQNAVSLLKKLSMDALIDAQREKINSGRLYGSAEANLGSVYYVDHTFSSGLVRMGIGLRSKD